MYDSYRLIKLYEITRSKRSRYVMSSTSYETADADDVEANILAEFAKELLSQSLIVKRRCHDAMPNLKEHQLHGWEGLDSIVAAVRGGLKA